MDKASWIAQIQTELKDTDIDSFNIKMDDHWEVSPFMHADDIEKTTSIGGQKEQLKWKILEQFDNSAEDHELIMLALKGGCESLMFQLGQILEFPFEKVLKGVFPEMVEFHFESKKMAPIKSNVEHFSQWLVRQGLNGKEIQGSFRIENPHQHQISVEAIIEHSSFVNSIFPKMNSVCWSIQLPGEKDGLTQPLISFLKGIVGYLQKIQSLDALQSILKSSTMKVEIGPNYLMEITRLRALRILWNNILLANGINNEGANIEAHFASKHYQLEAEKNMIIASTMAMSALVGGADSVFILPADGNPTSRDIHRRRIARNIHHLLRSEAHLEKHVDPVQGAYFFEYVVQSIVEKVWAKII
jgi:methylmalonyl-CoA mutase